MADELAQARANQAEITKKIEEHNYPTEPGEMDAMWYELGRAEERIALLKRINMINNEVDDAWMRVIPLKNAEIDRQAGRACAAEAEVKALKRENADLAHLKPLRADLDEVIEQLRSGKLEDAANLPNICEGCKQDSRIEELESENSFLRQEVTGLWRHFHSGPDPMPLEERIAKLTKLLKSNVRNFHNCLLCGNPRCPRAGDDNPTTCDVFENSSVLENEEERNGTQGDVPE